MYFAIITFFHILDIIFFINVYMVIFLFNTVIYIFLLLWLCILTVCLCIFNVPTGTLRLTWLRFLHVFFPSCKANARVWLAKTWHGPQSSKNFIFSYVLFYVLIVCTLILPPGVNLIAVDKYIYLLFVLYCSVYFLCVNVYFTTANGCQPNCS